MKYQFMWLDFETTGLDPAKGRILEWAVVLCEDDRGGDLAIVEQYSSVVHWPVSELADLELDNYVVQMHTANGLWHDVEQSDTTLAESETFLLDLATTLCPVGKVQLAGNSVHFDLAWARVHMPKLAAKLHHQVFDVRTLQRAVELWCPAARPHWPEPAHRALPDVLCSIERARLARKLMRGLADV
jgi:oligoribonuclease (3'-5' exoribonuclease)